MTLNTGVVSQVCILNLLRLLKIFTRFEVGVWCTNCFISILVAAGQFIINNGASSSASSLLHVRLSKSHSMHCRCLLILHCSVIPPMILLTRLLLICLIRTVSASDSKRNQKYLFLYGGSVRMTKGSFKVQIFWRTYGLNWNFMLLVGCLVTHLILKTTINPND